MNLALPALVILLGLLPGISAFYGYFAGRFDKRTAGVSGVEELALYVVLAIPIDAFSLFVCQYLSIGLDFGVAIHLISGSTLTEFAAAQVVENFEGGFALSAATYSAILAASYASGSLVRRLVWTFRLDVWIPLLRLKHAWFYVLQGRLKRNPREVLAYVDVLTTHPEGSRLYRGLVADFEIASNGEIRSLTMRDTLRGVGRSRYFKWKEIPSNTMTLMGATIHSINVTYFAVAKKKPPDAWARFRFHLRAFIRRILFEEP